MEDPLPLYTIVSEDDLPPAEEVHNSYHALLLSQGLSPSAPEYLTALDEIEVGWGSLPGNFDTCIYFRAWYAHSAGYPLTPSLVVSLFAGSATGTQRVRILWDAQPMFCHGLCH